MKVKFLGASGTVTGSCYLIETVNEKFLIDCGMFQGSKDEENLNYEPFDFNVFELDFCILTHAHIDHCGRIPKLVKDGFNGKIYCTNATKDLCEIMLLDSAKIQESDVEWENKRRQRSGLTAIEPLYSTQMAELSMTKFEGVFYHKLKKINENITIRFLDAGHILGSAIVEVWIKENGKYAKVVFSGDLGMKNKPIIRDPEYVTDADYVFMESTYGNVVHEEYVSSIKVLVNIIEKTVERGGTVIIPSFSIGRTQEIIYELNDYYDNKLKTKIKFPIYIDSPLAVKASEVFMNNSDVFDEFAIDLITKGDNIFEFENLKYVKTVEQSQRLNKDNTPKVIISASGMCTGGRVRHHLKHNLWNPKNSVIFVGYQAKGTLGNMLQEGIDKVKLVGEDIAVNAEIYSLRGFSGHADEIMLLDWISKFNSNLKKVFLVHGEADARDALKTVLIGKFGLDVFLPNLYDEVELVAKRNSMDAQEMLNLDKLNSDVKKSFENIFNRENFDFDDVKKQEIYKDVLKIQKELLNLELKLGK
ncbi:MAG: MBL fold metallo-hydrolase [Peptoniphilaceae bacterium]|uniref:MBL fold metallo-hydrolase n=1 Tax=Parvimonas sp. TaxID=1944660 RepID=UPI002A7526FB|nr:MBL fold metallo-hydrolase [Parvimonas sp.]MDD7764555.1 MBL fold metallo-hydrolase [Peptoniphilaceae bacterium]MDY3050533.1 MBL fold metallo-hydrolase [Parvimonas sp.]